MMLWCSLRDIIHLDYRLCRCYYTDVTMDWRYSQFSFEHYILCWFDLHSENHCLCRVLPLTWLSMKRKCCIIYGHSTMAAFISLSLFGVVVNNDQNTHGLLSSFPLSVSASLTRFLYLIPCTDDDASKISFSLCLPPHSDKCTHQLWPWGQAL